MHNLDYSTKKDGHRKIELVVIVGPTASGKSELAMRVARDFNAEIICADSRTVYKGMNIGTGKPSKKEQAAVRHHMIDIVDPGRFFSVADYKTKALSAVKDIQERGKLPILVGGSGLYVDAVLFDFEFLPPASPEARQHLNEMSVEELQQGLKRRKITPPLNYKNKRHLIRSLETSGRIAGKKKIRSDTLVIGLNPNSEVLKTKIASRNSQMVAAGLMKEVRKLMLQYSREAQSLDAIGYREWQGYFDGQLNQDEVRKLITKNSIAYARRQKTWFKRNPHIRWFRSPDKAFAFLTGLL